LEPTGVPEVGGDEKHTGRVGLSTKKQEWVEANHHVSHGVELPSSGPTRWVKNEG